MNVLFEATLLVMVNHEVIVTLCNVLKMNT